MCTCVHVGWIYGGREEPGTRDQIWTRRQAKELLLTLIDKGKSPFSGPIKIKAVAWSLESTPGSQIFKNLFKNMFRMCYVSGSILGTEDMVVNKTDKVLSS